MDTLILCLLGALFAVPMTTVIVSAVRGRKRTREAQAELRKAYQNRPTAEEQRRAHEVARTTLRTTLKGMQ